ncbi:TcmI family type II polyketide cyclase [Micromonospora sp. NPDC049101]|uniref:TcmI family type II polyketide cyclase n=1 Tax=Micromonospora sp. NPDC049101 TaxID=3155032 RepID=UPI0034032FE1
MAHEFYRYQSAERSAGRHRSLIVARVAEGAEEKVADLFAESDAGELPALVTVTSRSLLRVGSLYLHYIEAEQPVAPLVARHRDHPEFRSVNEGLAEYVAPYDPSTWRGPADAMARELRH